MVHDVGLKPQLASMHEEVRKCRALALEAKKANDKGQRAFLELRASNIEKDIARLRGLARRRARQDRRRG